MKEESIGKRLIEALTKEQLAQLISAIAPLLTEQRTGELLKQVDEDLESTLSKLLTKGKATKIISEEKFLEEWHDLWAEWNLIVEDVGNEEGKYVGQEHNWEEPYFDGSSLCEDLDKVANKMLPYLEKIHELEEEEEDLFDLALVDVEDNIDSYPEWLGAEHSDCYLGPALTRCLLKWKKLVADSLEHFITSVFATDESLQYLNLNAEAFVDFFTSLPPNDGKQIHKFITDNQEKPAWQNRLKSAYDKWHQMYHRLCAIFNPKNLLENSSRLLQEDWQCGLLLLENLLKDSNYREAERICWETIRGFIRKTDWEPEKSLLLYKLVYYHHEEAVINILEKWLTITEKLGMTERSAVLKIQIVTYKNPYDWDKIIQTLHEVKTPSLPEMTKQWQMFIVSCVIGIGENFGKVDDYWIKWLMDASLDSAKDEAKAIDQFSIRIQKWLKNLSQVDRWDEKQMRSLFILTCDLDEFLALKKEYPKLLKIVCGRRYEYEKQDEITSRRKWLRKMDWKKLLPLLMDCWKANIKKAMPDPKNVYEANYEYHAQWLAVAEEVNPTTFQEILKQWKEDHKRRRNLWKAIEKIRGTKT